MSFLLQLKKKPNTNFHSFWLECLLQFLNYISLHERQTMQTTTSLRCPNKTTQMQSFYLHLLLTKSSTWLTVGREFLHYFWKIEVKTYQFSNVIKEEYILIQNVLLLNMCYRFHMLLFRMIKHLIWNIYFFLKLHLFSPPQKFAT